MTVPSMTPVIAPSIDLLGTLGGLAAAPEGSAPGSSFESTLGAMIAAAFLQAPAAPDAPPPPAEPLLELVLDGEWVPEKPAEGTPPDEAAGTETPVAETIVTVQKSFHEWILNVSRKPDAGPTMIDRLDDGDVNLPLVEGDDFPERLEVIVTPVPIEPVDAAPAPVDPAVAAAAPVQVPLVRPPASPVAPAEPAGPSVASPETATIERPASEPTRRGVVERRELLAAIAIDQGLDVETLLALRAIKEPAIEIGGFAFPNPTTEADAATPLIPPEEWRVTPEKPAPAVLVERLAEKVARESTDRLRAAEPLVAEPAPRAEARPWAPSVTAATDGARVGGGGLESAGSRAGGSASPRREPSDEPFSAAPHRPEREAAPVIDGRAAPAPSGEGAAPASSRPDPTGAPQPASGVDLAAQRIARRVDHLMIDLKDDQGDYGRLKVSVAGPSVRATIMPNEPAMAERLVAGIRELKRGLEERGFAEPNLTVQAPKTEPAAGPTLGRDVLATATGAPEQRPPSRQEPEGDRRQRPTDPREEREQDGRPSSRSRDQRQEQRGNRG